MTNNTSAKIIKATDKQLAFLAQLGYAGDLRTLTIDQASGLIEQLRAQIDQAKQRILQGADILADAERRVELHREAKGEYSGPCPKCGGDDRFHCTKDWFACRQCHQKRGDMIEYTSWVNSVSFLEAIKMLDGGVTVPVTNEPLKPVKPVHKLNEWNEAKELQKALEAHKTLFSGSGKYAQQAREYLLSRGLTPETIEAFKLGFRQVSLPGAWNEAKKSLAYPKQSAILLPWFDRNGALIATKYRLLETHTYTDKDGKERTENKTSRGNFSGAMFGWQAVKGPSRNNVLIICEGEINALSLWQAGNGAVDVLSCGTESMMQTLPDEVIEFAQQYSYKIIWADRKEIANDTARRIKADFSMPSPNGKDANDFLKSGKLDKLLVGMLQRIGAPLPQLAPVQLPSAQPIEDEPADYAPPEAEVIQAGLSWDEAERLHNELKARVSGQIVYGIGADRGNPGMYRVVKREDY